MTATFTTPASIVTGAGSVEALGEIAAALGARALLVTGAGALRSAGVTDRLIDLLASAGVKVTAFEQVEPEPGVEAVDRAREAFAADHCDLLVAAGGGSAIDAGKAAAALADETAPAGEFFSDRPVPAAGRPCIAVPTTAGTGAEVTPNSVLSDPSRGIKQSLRGTALLPAAAIVDGELTASCPPNVTASAGMDALTQAIESYLSRHATPLTEALSVHAAELVWQNILAAYQQGDDLAARDGMAYASLLAGMALANARLGAVHGMAHPIGFRTGVRHGVVCAVLLPGVLRFNREAAGPKYDILQDIFGADPAEAAAYLLRRFSLPARLGGFGLREADFDDIAAESLTSGSLKANPKPLDEQDIKGLLAEVL